MPPGPVPLARGHGTPLALNKKAPHCGALAGRGRSVGRHRKLAPPGVGRIAHVAVHVGGLHLAGRPLGRAAVGSWRKGGGVAEAVGPDAGQPAPVAVNPVVRPEQPAARAAGPVLADLAPDADSEGGAGAGGSGHGDKTVGGRLLVGVGIGDILQGHLIPAAEAGARRSPAVGGVGDAPDGDRARALGRQPPVGAGLDGGGEGPGGIVHGQSARVAEKHAVEGGLRAGIGAGRRHVSRCKLPLGAHTGLDRQIRGAAARRNDAVVVAGHDPVIDGDAAPGVGADADAAVTGPGAAADIDLIILSG